MTKTAKTPLLRLNNVSKVFAGYQALNDVSLDIHPGQVLCLLGDNGAGKSTLIKVLAGFHEPTSGTFEVNGEAAAFKCPKDASNLGIATVHQFGGTFALMSIVRSFFVGAEPTKGRGPFRRFDKKLANEIAVREIQKLGITRVTDGNRLVGGLSGGERQSVAIARSVYFGAKVLILDEPTSALGVRQSGIVLKYVLAAKDRGVSVVFITHNPHHAYLVGDRFYLLNRGRLLNAFERKNVQLEELTKAMAGGAELETLTHEINVVRGK